MKSRSEWKRGAATAFSGCLGQAIGVMHLFSLGLFFAPLEEEYGWKRTEIAFGLTIASVIAFAGAPFVGKLIDRVGSRPVAIVGVSVYALGLLMLSLVGSSILSYWMAWCLLAFGALLAKPTVWVSGVVRWFNRNRGLAIAVLLSGGGITSTLIPAASSALIAEFGWRGAYVGLAAIAALAVPVIALFFDRGAPAGEHRIERPVTESKDGTRSVISSRSELLSADFVVVTLAAFLFYVSLVCMQIHFVPISVEKGIDRSSAAFAAGAVGIFSVIGRLTAGVLLDRFHTGVVGASMVSVALLGAFLLLGTTSNEVWIAVMAGALLGIGLGAELDVVAYYMSHRFRKENFGFLFGTFVGTLTLSSGLGSLLGSVIFDALGSYEVLKWVVWPCIASAVLVFARLSSVRGDFVEVAK